MEVKLLGEAKAINLSITSYSLFGTQRSITERDILEFLTEHLCAQGNTGDYLAILFEDSSCCSYLTELRKVSEFKLNNIARLFSFDERYLKITFFREKIPDPSNPAG